MKMIPRNNSFKKLNRPLDNQRGMRKKTKGAHKSTKFEIINKNRLKDRIQRLLASHVFEILYEMDDVLGEYKLMKLISVRFLHSTLSH